MPDESTTLKDANDLPFECATDTCTVNGQAGVRVPRAKFGYGPDGSYLDLTEKPATEAQQISATGAAGDTPPALASGASGMLGWTRKIVDTLALLIAVFPASLGAKPADESLSLALASDHPAIPTSTPSLVVPISGPNVLSAPGSVVVQVTPGATYTLCVSTITTLGATANTLASCTTTAGSVSVDYTGTAPAVGQLLAGTGITPGSYVAAVNPGVSFDMNLPATAAGTVTLNITAGSFLAVIESSPNGTTWTGETVVGKGYLYASTPAANIVAPGLFRYTAGTGKAFLRLRLASIALTGVAGDATAHAVRFNIDSYEKEGGAVSLPYVSYVAATAATFPTGIPVIMPVDMSGMGFASLSLPAFSGTSQTITWRQSNADDGSAFTGLGHLTNSAAQNASAITATAAGEYILPCSTRYLSAAVTNGTAVTAMTISGCTGTVGSSLPAMLAVNTINNQPIDNARWGGQTPIGFQANGSTNRALVAGIAGPTSNTDYSAQAWAASSGSGATISNANGLGVSVGYNIGVTSYTAGSSVGLWVFVQESMDNGTTWKDIWQSELITGVSNTYVPAIPVGGRRRMRWININATGAATAATTVTVTVTAMDGSGAAVRQAQWFDRTNAVTAGTAATGNSSAYNIGGLKDFTAYIKAGTATTAAAFKVQFSFNGADWFDVSSPVSLVASTVTPIPINAGFVGRLARFVCTSAGSAQLVTEAAIYGTN